MTEQDDLPALGRVGGEGGSPEASWEVGASGSSWDGVGGGWLGAAAGEGTAPGGARGRRGRCPWGPAGEPAGRREPSSA